MTLESEKECKLCKMKTIKDELNDEIRVFGKDEDSSHIQQHYRVFHNINPYSECEGCGKKFASLQIGWSSKDLKDETDDVNYNKKIKIYRKCYCDECSKQNPLKTLLVRNVDKENKNKDENVKKAS